VPLSFFRKLEEYEAVERFAMRLLTHVVMPNHWRLVVWSPMKPQQWFLTRMALSLF